MAVRWVPGEVPNDGNDIGYGDGAPDYIKSLGGNDTVYAGYGNDTIDGGTGDDSMYGQGGNDVYYVDSVLDRVFEWRGQSGGVDTVYSSVIFTLGPWQENLTLTGGYNISGTGNELNNTIRGNGRDNIIDGRGGGDHMFGGYGNDTYYVDSASDHITEIANRNGGIDKVFSSISWGLGLWQENLTLTGNKAISAFGNNLDNTIRGNNANNVIDGAGGDDIMFGRSGDDIYYVNSSWDQVSEFAGEGTDTIFSYVDYTLGSWQENLSLLGGSAYSFSSGSGNELNNVINGNNGLNYLRGFNGDDTIRGAGGDDVVVGGAGDDLINGTNFSKAGNGEKDWLYSSSRGDWDVFILGERGKFFYNDQGNADYAVIHDFDSSGFFHDQIQLQGSASSYKLSDVTVDNFSGTGIHLEGDLVGIVRNISASSLDLNDPNQFIYV